jgi:prepilin-type N-terminal cleavage/methylation domain-containing protein
MLNKKGFTLVELLVAIVIILIMAAIVIPTAINVSDSFKENLKNIEVITQDQEKQRDAIEQKEEPTEKPIEEKGDLKKL